MKRILFLLVFALGVVKSFSQEQINVGINGGLTIGSTEIPADFGFGAEANYLFDLFSEEFVLGPSIGISIFPSTVDIVDTAMFLPISGAFRFQSLDDPFYVGINLGYAMGLGDFDGGFHLKPLVGYHISNSLKLNAFYSGIRNGDNSIGYFGLGLTFNFLRSDNSYYSY